MEEKLKNLILKDIERKVKSDYHDNYYGNIFEINRYFFKLYGKKEHILLDALMTYAKSKDVEDIDFLSSVIDIFDINVITEFILNDKIKVDNEKIGMWIKLIKESSSKSLLFKFLNETKSKYKQFTLLLELMVDANPLTFYEDVKNIIVKIFNNLKENFKGPAGVYEFYYLFDNKKLKTKLNLPNFLVEEMKKYIDSLTFEEQVKLKQIFMALPDDFFNKIKESDYTIVGRLDNGVIMVKNLDNLYGYIDKNSKLIIPIVFDEISSVNKRGLIIGLINKKRGEMDPGIYKMDTSGKVIEVSPS